MPTTPNAIKELQELDVSVLRQVDFAELALGNMGEYHVLNLSDAKIDFEKYSSENNYQYLIIQSDKTDESRDVVNWFGGGHQNSYNTVPWFNGGWKNIFEMANNGPEIIIIEL